jgi:hypothetical protein
MLTDFKKQNLMFKHHSSRTKKHNLRIATMSILCMLGIVNVTGFLSFKQLTTSNRTFCSILINDVMNFNFGNHSTFLFIFSFLLGSFISSLLLRLEKKKTKPLCYTNCNRIFNFNWNSPHK